MPVLRAYREGSMGSPASWIVADLYIEAFEPRGLRTTENPPRLWKCYVDYIFGIQQIEPNDNFMQHINFIDSVTKFTIEDTLSDASISFLDTRPLPSPQKTQLHKPLLVVGQSLSYTGINIQGQNSLLYTRTT